MGSRTMRPGAPPLPLGGNMMGQNISNMGQPIPNQMQANQQIGSAQGQDYRINQVMGQQPQQQQPVQPYGAFTPQPAVEPTMNGQPYNPRRRLFRGGRY